MSASHWVYPPLVVALGIGGYHFLQRGRPSTAVVDELKAEVERLRHELESGPLKESDGTPVQMSPALARRLITLESRIAELEKSVGRSGGPGGGGTAAPTDLEAFRKLLAEVRRLEQVERDEQQADRILARAKFPLSASARERAREIVGRWFGRMREMGRPEGAQTPEALEARRREALAAILARDGELERALTPEEVAAVREALPSFPTPPAAAPSEGSTPPNGSNGR